MRELIIIRKPTLDPSRRHLLWTYICDPSQLNCPPGSAFTFPKITVSLLPLADSESLPLVLPAPKVIRLSADGVFAYYKGSMAPAARVETGMRSTCSDPK